MQKRTYSSMCYSFIAAIKTNVSLIGFFVFVFYLLCMKKHEMHYYTDMCCNIFNLSRKWFAIITIYSLVGHVSRWMMLLLPEGRQTEGKCDEDITQKTKWSKLSSLAVSLAILIIFNIVVIHPWLASLYTVLHVAFVDGKAKIIWYNVSPPGSLL